MKKIILFISLLFIVLNSGAKNLNDYQGISIEVVAHEGASGLKINGALSKFINCGSQYAIWNQFPRTILYVLKDLDTGNVYKSDDTLLSISRIGNSIYERYAKEPCNKIVTKEFSNSVTSINFSPSPKTEIFNFELTASYMGFSSNTLVINNTSLILNSTVELLL